MCLLLLSHEYYQYISVGTFWLIASACLTEALSQVGIGDVEECACAAYYLLLPGRRWVGEAPESRQL
jgi:hypothetical protein